MFLGHYSTAFGAKAIFPEAPLPALLLSAQLIDIVWAALVLGKVEKIEVDETATPTVPVRLTYIPYSHGLIGALVISLIAAIIALLVYPTLSMQVLAVIAFVGFSHWLLDLIVHVPDLPLIGNRYHVGFGLWHYRTASIVTELAFIMAGALLLAWSGAVTPWKALLVGVVMSAVQYVSFQMKAPKSPNMLVAPVLITILLVPLVGFWMEA